MKRLVVEQIVSVDGYTADKDGGIDFFTSAGDFSYTEDAQLKMLTNVDAIVLGANTYRMFAGYWPTVDANTVRIAEPINRLPKHVFSSTLTETPWGAHAPTVIEQGDVVAGVERLSQMYAGDLLVWGSLTLTDALFKAGRVDDLRLRVVPVLIGSGRALAPANLTSAKLTLTSSETDPLGHVSLVYTLRD